MVFIVKTVILKNNFQFILLIKIYLKKKGGIYKMCHRSSMEILINFQEITDQLRITMNDLYINEQVTNNTNELCKLKTFNETHARFLIPYSNDKCSTLVTVN